jgi:threonine dehydrogenase-like Zn-dependent dehydrogenase
MATRSTEPRMNRAKARAIAVRRDERLTKISSAVVTGLGLIGLLLLLTNP